VELRGLEPLTPCLQISSDPSPGESARVPDCRLAGQMTLRTSGLRKTLRQMAPQLGSQTQRHSRVIKVSNSLSAFAGEAGRHLGDGQAGELGIG
jgi:hypothetical protein